ncbi:Folate-biopterin transporter, partial [Globisporangium splendens]
MAPARLAFLERVCYISSSARLPPSLSADSFVDEFSAGFFPVIDDDNTSAPRTHRKPFQFCARVSLDLLAHPAATRLMHGTLINTITPFLTYYLNVGGHATTSARALLSLPWSLKAFASVITESFPVCGYRRRLYILLGGRSDRAYTSQEDLTRYLDGKVNTEVSESGRKSVLLTTLATLGFMFADVAAEGVVVDFSQRQERDAHERTQNLLYATRTVFQTIAQLILAIGLNSPDYGGDFGFGLSFSTVMLTLAIACAVVMPIAWYLKGSQFVRFEGTNMLLIMYAMKLLSLAFLPCLPAQELKRQSGSSPFIGAVAVLCFVAALIWSMMTSICAL